MSRAEEESHLQTCMTGVPLLGWWGDKRTSVLPSPVFCKHPGGRWRVKPIRSPLRVRAGFYKLFFVGQKGPGSDNKRVPWLNICRIHQTEQSSIGFLAVRSLSLSCDAVL